MWSVPAVSSLSRPVTARARGRGPMGAEVARGARRSRDAVHRPRSGLSTRSACAIGMLLLGLCGMSVHKHGHASRHAAGPSARARGSRFPARPPAPRREHGTRRNRNQNAPSPEAQASAPAGPGAATRGRSPGRARRVRVSADSVTPVSRTAARCPGAPGVRYAPRPPSKERRKNGHTGAPCAVRRHWPCAVYRARMTARGATARRGCDRPVPF